MSSAGRASSPGPLVGRMLRLEVGPAAHGGHCVARFGGRVVFVRHALPGEFVEAVVTEDHGGSFCRADVQTVITASPDRVRPPCRHAGICGGCDWQHARPDAQLRLKAEVVTDVLRRIGGLSDPRVRVRSLPGGTLGWRTRGQFVVDSAGRLGLRRHRSHVIEPVPDCPLVTDNIRAVLTSRERWPSGVTVGVAQDSTGRVITDVRRTRKPAPRGPALREHAAGRDWRVHAAGFWQVHPAAADALVATMLAMLAPRPGERALDLYAGVGLFAGALAEAVGPGGSVVAVEADRVAVADARRNLAGYPSASVRAGRVSLRLIAEAAGSLPAPPLTTGSGADRWPGVNIVVLDPPRTGTRGAVLQAVLELRPRAVCYVACDPAALARDLRIAREQEPGYELAELEAFDLFPNTAHVECVALLRPSCSGADP